MITLTCPQVPLDASFLAQAGGFGWWYVDICDEEAARGAVLILSFGLPFLPGIAGGARAGSPVAPTSRPSIHLVTYEQGRRSFYVLQELPATEADWRRHPDGEEWTFGKSRMSLQFVNGLLQLHAHLDISVDGLTRVRGDLSVQGRARTAAPGESATSGGEVNDVMHAWSPQTGVAQGRCELEVDGMSFSLTGHGYHDRNGARCPLHALGIARWIWGRASFHDEERIVYALWPMNGPPEVFGLRIEGSGATEVVRGLSLDLEERPTWLGVRAIRRASFRQGDALFLRAEASAPIDVGPFYLRSFWRAGLDDGRTAPGFCEVVLPQQIDRPHHRPFVRMRIATPSPSAFLPLFCGPRTGRLARLPSFWLRRRG